MKVKINRREMEINEAPSIFDAIIMSEEPYRGDCVIAVVRKEEIETREFLVETSAGKFPITIDESFLYLWMKFYGDIRVRCGWRSKSAITFGPMDLSSLKIKARRGMCKYKRGDLFLSFGGFDAANAYLCISGMDHEGIYGAPENYERIGTFVAHGFAARLKEEDSILSIYPIGSIREETTLLTPEEAKKVPVKDDERIITYVSTNLFQGAPNCVEHFLSAIGDIFEVKRTTSTFISSERSRPDLKEENTVYRTKGAITVRNDGSRAGEVYIYKEDALPAKSHSVVGKVVDGIELAENADIGDKILIKRDVKSLIVVGKTNKEARDYLTSQGIRHIIVEDEDDGAIIVEQRPKLTMEVKSLGSVVTLAMDPMDICYIEIWDKDAPMSASYFRRAADMTSGVGKLVVSAINRDRVILYSPIIKRPPLPFEKIRSKIEGGIIGVTNSERRESGVMGVRFMASDTYGPTGEHLTATNIIGKVREGLEFLKKRNAGDIVYLAEDV
jgi:Predicted peptidyl-prolyl cis-trans isomerase (rotamase), cyclophilin family